jgi:prophage regulatory protein
MVSMRILRFEELRAMTGLSRTTVWRLERDPSVSFPRRVRLGANATGWIEAEVITWLESRPRGISGGREAVR